MNLVVRGKNIEVTPALKEYVEKTIRKVLKQYKAVTEIYAVLTVDTGEHTVEITVSANGLL